MGSNILCISILTNESTENLPIAKPMVGKWIG